MEFEYDSFKSDSNLDKHGINFLVVQSLWKDPQALVVTARSKDELRYAIIGQLKGKVWTCIFTVREERIRIISARRARHGEEQGYDQS